MLAFSLLWVILVSFVFLNWNVLSTYFYVPLTLKMWLVIYLLPNCKKGSNFRGKTVMGNNLRNSKWNLWNRELPYISEVQRNRFSVRFFLNLKISNLSSDLKNGPAQHFQNGFKSKHLPWRLKWGTYRSLTEFMYT